MFDDIVPQLIKNSLKSNCAYKHAAAVIHKGNILSLGINYCKNNISVHAEIDAVINFMQKFKIKSLEGVDLIVIRQSNCNLKQSGPCMDCLRFLQNKKIRKIYFSDETGNIKTVYCNQYKTKHICSYRKLFSNYN